MADGHKCVIRIELTANEDFSKAEARIAADSPQVRTEFLILAAEHMMTYVAVRSSAGFDKALELLVEGAKTNHIHHLTPGGSA
jgi:hypothetical protein